MHPLSTVALCNHCGHSSHLHTTPQCKSLQHYRLLTKRHSTNRPNIGRTVPIFRRCFPSIANFLPILLSSPLVQCHVAEIVVGGSSYPTETSTRTAAHLHTNTAVAARWQWVSSGQCPGRRLAAGREQRGSRRGDPDYVWTVRGCCSLHLCFFSSCFPSPASSYKDILASASCLF